MNFRNTVYTTKLSSRIISILDKLQLAETNPTGKKFLSHLEVAHEVSKNLPTLPEKDYAAYKTFISQRLGSLYRQGKIKRTTKRIADRGYGYYTKLQIAGSVTSDELKLQQEIVEAAAANKTNGLNVIVDILPTLDFEELAHVQSQVATLMSIAFNQQVLEASEASEAKKELQQAKDEIASYVAEITDLEQMTLSMREDMNKLSVVIESSQAKRSPVKKKVSKKRSKVQRG